MPLGAFFFYVVREYFVAQRPRVDVQRSVFGEERQLLFDRFAARTFDRVRQFNFRRAVDFRDFRSGWDFQGFHQLSSGIFRSRAFEFVCRFHAVIPPVRIGWRPKARAAEPEIF